MIVPQKFFSFSHFPRNSKWGLATKSNKEKSIWRASSVFFPERKTAWCAWYPKNVIKKNQYGEDLRYFGGREYIAHLTKFSS